VKILVKADREVPYENLAQVLDAVKQGGVLKVALAVNNK
jgi:biopolymer transport protein ExbD